MSELRQSFTLTSRQSISAYLLDDRLEVMAEEHRFIGVLWRQKIAKVFHDHVSVIVCLVICTPTIDINNHNNHNHNHNNNNNNNYYYYYYDYNTFSFCLIGLFVSRDHSGRPGPFQFCRPFATDCSDSSRVQNVLRYQILSSRGDKVNFNAKCEKRVGWSRW